MRPVNKVVDAHPCVRAAAVWQVSRGRGDVMGKSHPSAFAHQVPNIPQHQDRGLLLLD
jgi:hypothetical protein